MNTVKRECVSWTFRIRICGNVFHILVRIKERPSFRPRTAFCNCDIFGTSHACSFSPFSTINDSSTGFSVLQYRLWLLDLSPLKFGYNQKHAEQPGRQQTSTFSAMANPLDTDAGSELFSNYEAELKLVQADLSQKLDQITELSGEPRKSAVRLAERSLEEANELVRTSLKLPRAGPP